MSNLLNKEWVKIGGAIILPHLGGFLGGYITSRNVKEWYNKLKKPSFTPPNWVFGPVWTTLYTGMGYASYLIYRDGGGFEGAGRNALMLYGTQIALNWTWSPLFFGAHKMGLALAEISCLTATIAGCIYLFYPINKVAAGLMVPYLAWGSLATALNFKVWQLNKDDGEDDEDDGEDDDVKSKRV